MTSPVTRTPSDVAWDEVTAKYPTSSAPHSYSRQQYVREHRAQLRAALEKAESGAPMQERLL